MNMVPKTRVDVSALEGFRAFFFKISGTLDGVVQMFSLSFKVIFSRVAALTYLEVGVFDLVWEESVNHTWQAFKNLRKFRGPHQEKGRKQTCRETQLAWKLFIYF